ncbi:hypothetical protein [Clostridium coskatii]|uniref:DUF7210 domain-containing protein n=1 Tax=Clostridium coskatii TaxID=1705578 RepID=A0A166SZS0_9CLOT|nr:hypothetical protein [Clostridium coskatii]OAA93010.1 hypothetical protein WX73_00328 [Clostridium coskatii]OBR90448.1 hypothetical protein CLCOS_40060 [Clostridium coskatii]
MAAAKEKENMIEVTAKVNMKYDTDIKKVGEKLKIRESDLKELQDKGYISYTPPVQTQQPGQGNGQQTPPPADK